MEEKYSWKLFFWIVQCTCDTACGIILTPSLPFENCIFLSASTIAENGRKTCLKLKVFVRPSSKCLHATQGFVIELVEVHIWIENQNSLCLLLWLPHFLLNYLFCSLSNIPPFIYHKTALLAKKMFFLKT